ncbi:MAG: molybdate ABC transporter permease subunit [Anaerolineae bacterium]|nr:molybdate ABC transporter permease subunit [Phycisphaerae bacterium]
MSDLLSAISLSLRIALSATVIVALIGVPLAYLLARRKFFGRSVIETLLTVPLVLPPTVVGYLIILSLGVQSPIGELLDRSFGYRLLFSLPGAILAAVVVSLPLLLLPARAAFAAVEPEYEEIARLFGAGRLQTFWHVNLPLARRGIASGLLLAFARALGEFGATIMVFGSLQDRQTLPISIYQDFLSGERLRAAPAVVLLSAVSFAVMIVYNRWPGSTRSR